MMSRLLATFFRDGYAAGRSFSTPRLPTTTTTNSLSAASRFRSIGSDNKDGGSAGAETPTDWPILANASYEIEIPLPEIKRRVENVETTRARLLYQSRKRGMAENDILISTFAQKYLPGFDVDQLCMYDDIINKPSNDWDLYYWMTGASPIPAEFNNKVMDLMVEHSKNTGMEVRITQPPLEPGKMMLGYDADEEKN